MIINLLDGDVANISFSNSVKISIRGDSGNNYFVKWYRKELNHKDDIFASFQFVGQMDLNTGTWGKFDYDEIDQWKLEIYKDNQFITEYDNNLKDKNVIVVAKKKPGKNFEFNSLKDYCENIVKIFHCNLKVYFPDSCRYDFSQLNFQPLRLNDNIQEMHFGIEKEF